MVALSGAILSEVDFKLLGDAYRLSSSDEVKFPSPESRILSPPPGKKNGCSIQMLTLNAVNKAVVFEMICPANDPLPDYFVFKYFFRFCATGDKYTFSVRRGVYTLVSGGKTPKNWQDKWLWVNRDLLGNRRYRANNFADVAPKLYPYNRPSQIS
ncbi:unnamed protein product [Lactuca saligna]|uniref:Uncharacterized protein n=1 Tax=Lactuca saligna TaxID=75948 RepID=A0AA35YCH7_LACSI|nr:unnamed protein product [Lactuca saligna]